MDDFNCVFFDEKEKCSHYYIDLIENCEELNDENLATYESYLPIEVSHGDIVIIDEKDGKYNYKRELIQSDPTEMGYCCVPLAITKHLRDPLKFYEDAFNFNNYDEVDFSGIEIDTRIHEKIIKKFTGGKRVAHNRKCFYFLSQNEWDSTGGMFIWCDFFLDDFDMGRYLKLTPDINEFYLCEKPLKIRDEQIKQAAYEMKSKYEIKFTNQFLNILQGTEVEVYGITFFCPKMDNHCGTVLTMVFNRIEMNRFNQIEKIVLNRLQIDTVTINEISKVLDFNEEFVFRRKVLTHYGRFGGVELWCIENASIISNDEDEKPSTYVICSPDLFL